MKWVPRRLDDIADFRLGKMLDGQKNRGEPLPYLANVNVRWGGFDLDDLRQMRFEHDEMERYGLKYGDIVMCEGGEPGRCAIWKETVPGMMIQKALHRIRAQQGVDHRFLFYTFLHLGRIGGFAPLFTGATIRHLPRQQLAKLEVRLPPAAVQARIASILSAYDDLIENNNRRIALLEQAARLLYEEWFTPPYRFPGSPYYRSVAAPSPAALRHPLPVGEGRGEGRGFRPATRIVDGVPKGWEKATAFDAMDILSGGTPRTTTPEFWDGDIPFYTPKDSTGHIYVTETEKTLTERGLATCSSRLYPKDTLFITARGTVGKLNLAQRPMAMNQSCYALVGKGHLTQRLLYCAVNSAITHFQQQAVGAVFDAIIVDTFKLIPFVVPGERLVRLFDDTVAPIFAQAENLTIQNQRLKAARDLLLPRLMSGEIAV
jgi:type I restriction enzyme S subunit